MKLTYQLFVLSSVLVIVGTSYAYAQYDNMQSGTMNNASMSGGSWSNNGTMMNEKNTSNSMMNNQNMSGAGWGSNNTVMNGESMMSSGMIDLSMASPVRGSSSAPVTIVEFGDYQCPKCDAWFKNEEPTIKANYIDTNKAKLYFVDFPFLGADSPVAAQAAYCAGDQGKYWEYHDYLYTNQQGVQSGWASASNLKSYAGTLGLDTTQFNSCLDSGKYADRISHNKDIGMSKGVQGTPAFFIIGSTGTMQEIMGPQPATAFSTAIDEVSTQATPEFGPIAALVLAIAIISIIVVSAKTGFRFTPKY
ncbi:Thioredoxin [uncultured archaeon]|nr:Thioredoxin [uncultured archaeon]